MSTVRINQLQKSSALAFTVKNFCGFTLLKNWPRGHFFRFIVDGIRQKESVGKIGYEATEPKSFEGMIRGIKFLLENQTKRIDASFLKELHRVVMTDVEFKEGDAEKIALPGRFRTNYMAIPIDKRNATRTGLMELCKEIADKKTSGCVIRLDKKCLKKAGTGWESARRVYEEGISNCVKIDSKNHAEKADAIFEEIQSRASSDLYYVPFIPENFFSIPDEVAKLVEKVFENYYQRLATCTSLLDIVRLIVDTAVELERNIHPFHDGNCRCIVTLLANFMLMQNGLPFACFADPNLFDFASREELVVEILKGITMTLSIYTKPTETYFDFNPTGFKLIFDHWVRSETAFFKSTETDKDKLQELEQLLKWKIPKQMVLALAWQQSSKKYKGPLAFYSHCDLHPYSLVCKRTNKFAQPALNELAEVHAKMTNTSERKNLEIKKINRAL